MVRASKYLGVALACLFILSGAAAAQMLDSLTDEFYNGLADIIEQNMNDPQACVTAVDGYFTTNQDKVEQIRKQAAEAMEAIGPEIDKYMSMTEEEAKAMAEKQGTQPDRQPKMSAAGQRYNDALKAFSLKYPQYGMKIAGKTMQLVPGFSKGPAQASPQQDSTLQSNPSQEPVYSE